MSFVPVPESVTGIPNNHRSTDMQTLDETERAADSARDIELNRFLESRYGNQPEFEPDEHQSLLDALDEIEGSAKKARAALTERDLSLAWGCVKHIRETADNTIDGE